MNTTIEVPKEKAEHLKKISVLEAEALKIMAEKSEKHQKAGTIGKITDKLKSVAWMI